MKSSEFGISTLYGWSYLFYIIQLTTMLFLGLKKNHILCRNFKKVNKHKKLVMIWFTKFHNLTVANTEAVLRYIDTVFEK